jgi:fatty-acyl-CoA synthase
VEAHFSIPAIGAILVMLNPWLTTDDLLYLLNHSEAKVLILDAQFIYKIPLEVHTTLTHLQKIIIFNNPVQELCPEMLDYETCLAAEDGTLILDEIVCEELDPITLNFTSGTTGLPKGVLCSHRAAYLHALGQVLMMELSKTSKYLWLLPMFHVNGWGHLWANVAVGATQIILSHSDRENGAELAKMLTQQSITHLCGAPRFIQLLIEALEDKQALERLTITIGGAAPSPKLIQELENRGVRFIHQYGLNETYGPYVVCEEQHEWQNLLLAQRVMYLARQGVATIHAGTGLRVVDKEMNDVPHDGQTLGEVVMVGNTVMLGYYKDPEATKRAFRNGWFHSGDMAVVHPDGYLEIRDRIKDLIYVETNYGWENISSLEIERVLCQHEQVREAAVVGISVDDKAKNSPILVAFVEALNKRLITEENLLEFYKHKLAPHQQPYAIYFVDLPKTATGKVRKDLLVTHATRMIVAERHREAIK